MIRYNIGFLLAGLINNYNFVIILNCAYIISQAYEYINPSLILLFSIVPGFTVQTIFPYTFYKLDNLTKIIFLFVTQIISNIILITTYNINLILVAIAFTSINSYFGETTFLIIATNYDKNQLKYWSIGTGLAGIIGTSLYILFNMFLPLRTIFVINLFIYYIFLSGILYLLDYKRINKRETYSELSISENYDEQDYIANNIIKNDKPTNLKEYLFLYSRLLVISNPIWLSYLFGYIIGISYVTTLSKSEDVYLYSRLISQVGTFCGRFLGNYKSLSSFYGIIHIYNVFVIIFFSILIYLQYYNYYLIIPLLFVCNVINGICYSGTYKYIYETYDNNIYKDWYISLIGLFTSFATIIAAVIGYFFNLYIH